MQLPTKTCGNCKANITEDKIELHEVYCFKNIRKCQKCDEYVDKAEMEDHMEGKFQQNFSGH